MYDENVVTTILKNPWKTYEDVKTTIRKILYNNYYYIGNFMNSHNF